ncbi:MAG: hypothetical protein ACJ72X_13945 [Nitrososphaeraceae archaeon]
MLYTVKRENGTPVKDSTGNATFELGHKKSDTLHISSSFYKSKICFTTSKIRAFS